MKNKRFIKQITISLTLLASALLFGYVCRFEIVSRMVRPLSVFVTSGLNFITSLVPFSLMQIALPAFFIGNIAVIIYHLAKKEWLMWLPKVIVGCAYVCFAYVFFYSYGFSLPYVSNALPYTIEKHSIETLAEVTKLLIADLNEAEEKITRDENGIVDFDSFADNAEKVNEGYRKLMERYDFTMTNHLGRPKQAGILSVPMSYFNINGVFFPFLAEANVSEDMVPTHSPYITAHEQAHTIGIVRENEANFFAFLACLESGDSQLEYSAYLNAYVYAINAVFRNDYELGAQLSQLVNDNVRADLVRLNEHIAKYDTPLKEAGTKVNDTMLKANGQTDGIKTYGYMTDLLISYYLSKE